jgi:formyltetrahydrofolate-dependent phosphoribosylglycinamide formyltransferase
MFERLQQKWKVGPVQIILIITCFALGGSLTGYSAKKIMDVLSVEKDWLWTIIYILLVTIIWPLAVLIVSFFFGQFKFFKGYVTRLGQRIGIVRDLKFEVSSPVPAPSSDSEGALSDKLITPSAAEGLPKARHDPQLTTHLPIAIGTRLTTNIAIFASGAGSNAQRIIDHFRNSPSVKIALIVCNKKKAGVLQIAEKENIPSLVIEKEKFFSGSGYLDELASREIGFIVLAGFLWKVPEALIRAFPKRIINIHPALLPGYGGQGMYGSRVHEAVIRAQEKESGITIHYVDEHYDKGDIILQVKCPVLDNDTSESLAHRVHELEYANYPVVIEDLVKRLQATRYEP